MPVTNNKKPLKMYSNLKCMEMILTLGEGLSNSLEASRIYINKFSNCQHPNAKIIKRNRDWASLLTKGSEYHTVRFLGDSSKVVMLLPKLHLKLLKLSREKHCF